MGVHCPISSTFLYENFPKNMEGKRLGGKEMETINMDNLLQRKQRSGELEGNVRVADKLLFFQSGESAANSNGTRVYRGT